MGQMTRAYVCCVVLLGATHSHAQNAPTPSVAPTTSAKELPIFRVLPPVPNVQLRFPVMPLRFSYSALVLDSYIKPLELYRAESLWLQTPQLSLLTIGSQSRALELDCRLTCQPVVTHSVALEARLALPSMGPTIQDPHAFISLSSSHTETSVRRPRLLQAGFAGAF